MMKNLKNGVIIFTIVFIVFGPDVSLQVGVKVGDEADKVPGGHSVIILDHEDDKLVSCICVKFSERFCAGTWITYDKKTRKMKCTAAVPNGFDERDRAIQALATFEHAPGYSQYEIVKSGTHRQVFPAAYCPEGLTRESCVMYYPDQHPNNKVRAKTATNVDGLQGCVADRKTGCDRGKGCMIQAICSKT